MYGCKRPPIRSKNKQTNKEEKRYAQNFGHIQITSNKNIEMNLISSGDQDLLQGAWLGVHLWALLIVSKGYKFLSNKMELKVKGHRSQDLRRFWAIGM